MGTKGMSGAEAFLRLLSSMGVECIFASPGSEWAPVWEQLANPNLHPKPSYFSSRHEEVAVAMASGYAKSSGKLPAVMVHTTVGSLHASMALRAALHEGVPMVVFAGESIAFGETTGFDPGSHWLGQLTDISGPAKLMENSVKWSFGVNSKAVLPATIQRACQLAMAPPRGPVFISLPMEFLSDKLATDAPANAAMPVAATADDRGLEQLAEMLLNAARPIIVTEECGRNPAAVKRLVEISELVSAPVLETRMAGYCNFPRTHANHAGFDANEFVGEADVILLIDTTIPWHPPSRGLRPDAKVVTLGENPLRADLPYWGYRVDLCLLGAIESSLHRLLNRLRKRRAGKSANRENWVKRLGGLHRDRTRTRREEAVSCRKGEPIDSRWVLYELNETLPGNAILVEETITDRAAINHYLDRLGPGQFFAGAIGGLGTGLGTALGVKCAQPALPVVLVIGDGSFNYNSALAALGFIQEHEIPIMIVMLNNCGYLSQKQAIPRLYPDGWAAKTNTYIGTSISPYPNYADLVRIFGGHGETVSDPAEVRPSIERALKMLATGTCALLDIRLKPVN